MSLDPHARRFLDLLAANRRGSMPLAHLERRRAFQSLARMMSGDDVRVGAVTNTSIPGPAGPLAIRIYTPAAKQDRVSAGMVYFHGGGWVIGSLVTHDGICARLAEASNCRIVAVDYRLAPEHKFPCAIEDAIAATQFVAANAAAFGIDPSRLAIGGDSAGANIAAVVCQWVKHACKRTLALQALFCPVMDALGDTDSRRAFAEGYFLDKSTMEEDLLLYCSRGVAYDDPRLSPLRAADFSGLPPAHIHTAECDPVRDEGKSYAEKLVAAGVPVTYRCHAGMIHHFYGMTGVIPAANVALRDAAISIGRALA
jgi:acetyl esterase